VRRSLSLPLCASCAPHNVPLRVELMRSSNLRTVSYDTVSQTLTIEFRSATSYRYFRVPFAVYAGLIRAPSPGGYFVAQIRDRYSFRKI
jgi:lysyl-tRNA synthetase class 2